MFGSAKCNQYFNWSWAPTYCAAQWLWQVLLIRSFLIKLSVIQLKTGEVSYTVGWKIFRRFISSSTFVFRNVAAHVDKTKTNVIWFLFCRYIESKKLIRRHADWCTVIIIFPPKTEGSYGGWHDVTSFIIVPE